jgi:hypothetical protein
MRIHPLPNLSSRESLPAGAYLMRVIRAQAQFAPRGTRLKITFGVIEPLEHSGKLLAVTLPEVPKQQWKLIWFLKDFEYSSSLIFQDRIDALELVGSEGVVCIGYSDDDSRPIVHSFAPAHSWDRAVSHKQQKAS